MKIKISQEYSFSANKHYILVNFYGKHGRILPEGENPMAYNFSFELPDIIPNDPCQPALKTILDNLEIGINQMLEMADGDIRKEIAPLLEIKSMYEGLCK